MMRRLEPVLARARARRRHRLRRHELDPGRRGRGREAVAFADGRRPWLAHVEAGLRSFNPAHARGAQPDRGRPPGGPAPRPDPGGDGQPRPRGARRARGAGRRRDGRRHPLGHAAAPARTCPSAAREHCRNTSCSPSTGPRTSTTLSGSRAILEGLCRPAAGRLSRCTPGPARPWSGPRSAPAERRPHRAGRLPRDGGARSVGGRDRDRLRRRPEGGVPVRRPVHHAAQRDGVGPRRSRPAGIASSTPIRPRSPMRWPTRPSCGATARVRRSSATEMPPAHRCRARATPRQRAARARPFRGGDPSDPDRSAPDGRGGEAARLGGDGLRHAGAGTAGRRVRGAPSPRWSACRTPSPPARARPHCTSPCSATTSVRATR